ncbi:MAG: 2-oxo acid dehydrogenase subunit E2 [Candidatus Binatia bacterium]|nr:2-oxo acid dehydrogenase subunit E2 [Candidatus Binatia bacterium]
MAIEIRMPKLSDTMEEGTILRWYKRVGEMVQRGEVIAEVETDKADMEVEAEASGIVREIRVPEGESAPVGAVLAILEEVQAGVQTAAPTRESAPPPVREPTAAPRGEAAAVGKTAAKPAAKPAGPAAEPAPERRTGAAQPRTEAAESPAPAPAPPLPPSSLRWKPRLAPTSGLHPGRHPESRLRQTVAKQMAQSKREIPHFYVTSEIDMTEAARLREQLLAANVFPERITYTHLLIRALALVLPRHPRANASWIDGTVEVHEDINIGIAVAVEDGLVAPVIHRCQHLGLREIAQATQGLVEKAQAGKFTGAELVGATFTISNMGMLDIDSFAAVITPPQSAILAVGSIRERPVVRAGQLAVAKTMRVTLSADHRVLNGVEAGRFLEDLKHTLEQPIVLVL